MPYKFEYTKKRIPREFDRRVKLTDLERKKIKELYGKISQRNLAKMFGVSRRLITYIGCPEKLERAKELYKDRRKDGRYYDRKKHTKAMKKYRKYKNNLNKKDKLE